MGFGQPAYPQQSSVNLSPAQSAYQTNASNWLSSQIGNVPSYSGSVGPAPLSAQQAQSIGQIGAVGQQAGAPAQAQGLATLGNTAAGGYLFDPFVANELQSTANYAQNQFQQAIPGMESPFIAAGQTGNSSPMAQYLTQQNANFQLGLQNQLAQEAIGSYQGERQLQQQAANEAATQGGLAQQGGLSALTVPQATQSQALSNLYNQFLQQQQSQYAPVSAAPGLISQIQGTTSPPLYGQSPFSQLTSGLASLAPIAALFM